MSGGSFNYLCFAGEEEIGDKIKELKEMRDILVQLGYEDAAEETESVLLIIQQKNVQLRARISRLSKVWRSIEWLESGDGTKDQVEESIHLYRKM